MRIGQLFRPLGAVVYGLIGWELGVALAATRELTTISAPIILPFAIVGLLFGFFFAPWIITAPVVAARNSLRQIPIRDLIAGTVGLAVGLFIAALLSVPIANLPPPFGSILPLVMVIVFGYLGAAITLLRQEDIFALFQRSAGTPAVADNTTQTQAPLLLDTSVIIDGRIADVAETGFLMGKLLVPRFVLNELQYIADSSDTLRRNRGRRGLEMLDRLQADEHVEIEFIDQNPRDAQQVDDKLVSLGRTLDAAVVTNDYNLNHVARLQGVTVLNINELANAVKAKLLPGEEMPLKIIQEGKEVGQGVGYLEDGTMVVVEGGQRYLNQDVLVQVTKVLQTNAGRLIFATPDGG